MFIVRTTSWFDDPGPESLSEIPVVIDHTLETYLFPFNTIENNFEFNCALFNYTYNNSVNADTVKIQQQLYLTTTTPSMLTLLRSSSNALDWRF